MANTTISFYYGDAGEIKADVDIVIKSPVVEETINLSGTKEND